MHHTVTWPKLNTSRLKEYLSKPGLNRIRGIMHGDSIRKNPYSLLSERLREAIEDRETTYEELRALDASHFPCESESAARGIVKLV